MSAVISALGSLFSDPNKGMKRQVAAQQQQQQSDLGRQLAETSKTQAEVDQESAGLRKPGRGRKMLSYADDNAGATYGS